MKEKVIYFIFGAVFMFMLLRFIPTQDIVQDPEQVGVPHKSVEQSPATSEVTHLDSMPPSADEVTEDTLEESGFSNDQKTNDVTGDTKIQALMTQMSLQKLKAKFKEMFDENDPKLEQLLALSESKISRDGELMRAFSDKNSINDNQKIHELMAKDDSELTFEERSLKQEQIEAGNQYHEALEQSRVAFEDSAKNLLSLNELEELAQQEQESSQQDYERHLDVLGQNATLDQINLNSFQKSQIDGLWSKYKNIKIGEVPIGSTISQGLIGTNSMSGEAISNLYRDLSSILTAEQMATFQSTPLMFMN